MRSPFLAYGEFTINFILLAQGAAAIKTINLIRLKKTSISSFKTPAFSNQVNLPV